MKENEKRFAFDYLVPEKGKYVSLSNKSGIALFVVVIVFLFFDGLKFDFLSLGKILFYCLVITYVLWAIAFLFKKVKLF